MDYYQQGRSQGSTAQSSQHVYAYQTPTSVASNSMYYQNASQQQQPQQMSHQTHTQQPSYQQHYSMQAGSANASMDYNSQHNQSGMAGHHSQSTTVRGSGGRSGPRGATSSGTHAHVVGGVGDAVGQAARFAPTPTVQVQELPLRIVIDSKHVGAIIGTGGNNIREITKESKARVVVDVQRTVKDQQGHSEKIISIVGPLENCSKACVKILEVVQREQEKDDNRESNDVELKIRAHNQLVGRLIGKQGVTIKKIMQDTGTTIFVSNSNDSGSRGNELGGLAMPPFPDMIMQMERTITVKGPTIDCISLAEQKISSKLRQSYDTDIQNRLSMSAMPGVPGMGNPIGDAAYNLMNMRPIQPMLSGQTPKVTKMYVPNSMVGAIIGAKGTHIRNIMRNSGANIRIEGGDKKERSSEDEEKKESGAGDAPAPTPAAVPAEAGQGDGVHGEEKKEDERLVTITGTDMQQYRAQFWIFQRVSEQSQHFLEEVKLRTELAVPSRLVGRIIGKGGQNVRELQRITGASVKIPEDEAKGETSGDETKEKEKEASGDAAAAGTSGSSGEGTMVRIVGNFQATQAVQLRIGQLIHEFNRASIQERRRGDGDNHDSGRKQTPPSNGERNE